MNHADLATVLHGLADRGRLNYLSVTADDGKFHVVFVDETKGQFYAQDEDPVQAILRAVGPGAQRVNKTDACLVYTKLSPIIGVPIGSDEPKAPALNENGLTAFAQYVEDQRF